MPSIASRNYDERAQDVALLMGPIREDVRTNPGKRGYPGPRVEVLNRSAVVLITGMWEGYIEELVAGAVSHLITHSKDPSKLPKKLLAQVAKELHDQGPSAAWQVAGNGWKMLLANRMAEYAAQTALNWNTPMSGRIDSLFSQSIGMDNLTDCWAYATRTADDNRAKIDKWVRLRGDIAHGSGAAKKVTKRTVHDYRTTVFQLIKKTDAAVNAYALKETGASLF